MSEFDNWLEEKMGIPNFEFYGNGIARATARKLIEVMEGQLKANPETSFNPNSTAWQIYDYIKQWCGEL